MYPRCEDWFEIEREFNSLGRLRLALHQAGRDMSVELLERHKPSLRYDSLETYFADSAEIWLANPHSRLSDANGKTIASAADRLSLSFLDPERYPEGPAVQRSDFIESTRGDYQRQYSDLRAARPELRNVIYARSVESHARLWLQYWFFYFFNDYQLAWGIGVHEETGR